MGFLHLDLPHLPEASLADRVEDIKHLLGYLNDLGWRRGHDCALLAGEGDLIHLEKVVPFSSIRKWVIQRIGLLSFRIGQFHRYVVTKITK